MQFTETSLPGVWVIEPKVWGDERGYFVETFKQEEFLRNIGSVSFIQDNESKSSYGVLRGLHFQKEPYSQAKLVRVVQGAVLDVAVDIRKGSPYFGKHIAVELTEQNKKQLFIPRGFAHGFVVLSPTAIFNYKVDNVYAPQHEDAICYNDKDLNIDWQIPVRDIQVSAKDGVAQSLASYCK